jgi:protein-S-isoprenylcysteine O-methyltransferase Ste14
VKKVLGWIGTILFFGFIVALLFAEELLPELLRDRIPDVPDWIAWLGLGLLGAALLGLWSYVLLNPKHWRQWRQASADRRERRRRLENFEVD